jgi:hypothetical protein
MILGAYSGNALKEGHSQVNPTPTKVELELEGNPDFPRYKETVALLDHSGLAYRVAPAANSDQSGAPRLIWGDETLIDVAKDKVVAFLWAHGARFEDS